MTKCAAPDLPRPATELVICLACSTVHTVDDEAGWENRKAAFIAKHYDDHGKVQVRIHIANLPS